MFIVNVIYKKPLTEVDRFLEVHRAYIHLGYEKNYLVASGPKTPRDGAIIISNLQDKKILEDFLEKDPFKVNGIADYEIIEFQPVKYHQKFATFVE